MDEVKSAMEGLLKPEYREEVAGEAEILQIFHIPKVGVIAGCRVQSGSVERDLKARLYRGGIEVGEAKVVSLKREKDDAKTVKAGFECGIGLEGVSVAPSAELRAYCERILYRLGYSGIGCLQFLVDDASGATSLLELNPRLDSTAALACKLGYDFPRLAVEIAARSRPAPLTTPYAVGRHYHWMYGDLNAWRQGKIAFGVMARAALRGCDLTLDWRDPAPCVHLLWRKMVSADAHITQSVPSRGSVGSRC